jgi:trimeric autotransporter adhesin
MRRHLMLALVSSASLGLFAAAGCSSSDDNGAPTPDASTPDAKEPDSALPDASTPDAPPPREAGPHEPGWDPSFSLPGVAGRVNPTVNAIARIANRQIALAGNFEQAGSIPTKFVALWNGDKWLSISSGLPAAIEKMVATPTGELYGSVDAAADGYKLFKWNKTVWSEVAAFDGQVRSLDVAPDGTLYVSGWFTQVGALPIAGIAKLVGNTWSEVAGAPEGVSVVRAVGAKICVGGRFDPWSGGFGVECVDNGTWQKMPFGDGAGEITDIGEQNGQIVAAGAFQIAGAAGGSLARWTGSAWEPIGGGVEGGPLETVKDMEIDGNKIYVAGDIRFAGGQQVSHVAMWDVAQARWSSLNDGIYGSSGGFTIGAPAEVLALDQGGELYVGGRFSLIGGRNALAIARWDGNQWNPVDDPTAKRLGVNGSVSSIAEGPNGAIYVGGVFPMVGGDVAANRVARFENETWSTLGGGFDGNVSALAVSGTTVYAGGDFVRSGPATTRSVAQWNGATWSSMGGGLDGAVGALAMGPDGNLYAGGAFTESNGTVLNHIARWNGAVWQALGDGFDGSVNALAFDQAGKLYAGGSFETSGTTVVNHVAVWNGTAWAAMGAGVSAEFSAGISAMVLYDGKITIGGRFTTSGDDAVEGLAAWDGSKWRPIGGGVHASSPIASLAVRGSELYVTGFGLEGGPKVDADAGTTFKNIAMWNGTTWSTLGDGLSDLANVITTTKDAFWVGGGFTFAGNQGSYNIARYWFDEK